MIYNGKSIWHYKQQKRFSMILKCGLIISGHKVSGSRLVKEVKLFVMLQVVVLLDKKSATTV